MQLVQLLLGNSKMITICFCKGRVCHRGNLSCTASFYSQTGLSGRRSCSNASPCLQRDREWPMQGSCFSRRDSWDSAYLYGSFLASVWEAPTGRLNNVKAWDALYWLLNSLKKRVLLPQRAAVQSRANRWGHPAPRCPLFHHFYHSWIAPVGSRHSSWCFLLVYNSLLQTNQVFSWPEGHLYWRS